MSTGPTDPAAERHNAAVHHRRVRRRRRRRRRVGWVLVGLGALGLLTIGWVAVTGALAAHRLQAVQAGVDRVQARLAAGDLAGARQGVTDLAVDAAAAHRLTTGPAWWLTAAVPGVGAPAESVRGIAAGVDTLAGSTLPTTVELARQVQAGTLRRPDGGVDLDLVARLTPGLDAANDRTQQVAYALDRLPATTWLPAVDDARTRLAGVTHEAAATLGAADDAARLLPGMLGGSGTRRYFVGFQNNAEARGGGGLPGAFGILAVTGGGFTFETFGDDSAFDGVTADVDLGADFAAHYADFDPTGRYLNSTVSPDFADTGRLWTAYWQARTGQALDGAITVDPVALSSLLRAAGPVTLADGTTVGADTVVDLTERGVYAKFPGGDDNAARRAYLQDVARTVDAHLLAAGGDTAALLRQAGSAVAERRIAVWSAHPDEQRLLARTALGGTLPTGAGAFAMPVLQQRQATKLDYYLGRTFRWERSGCGAVRDVTATVALTNNAPADLPPYVTGVPSELQAPVGDDYLSLDYLATAGAQLVGVDVDGTPTTFVTATQAGHPAFRVDVVVPRGTTRTVVLHLREPDAGDVRVLTQPLTTAMPVTTSDSGC